MRIVSGILELVGFCSLGYGLYQYEPWIAWAICGVIVMFGGILVDIMVK